MEVVHQRLDLNRNKLIEVEVYFLTKFNSLETMDGKISKWGLFELVKSEV
jgi:hypothetical protein